MPLTVYRTITRISDRGRKLTTHLIGLSMRKFHGSPSHRGLNMRGFPSTAAFAAAVFSLPTTALADAPVLQPVQIGSETLRFDKGVPTLDLQMQQGSVQIRPLPMDHGSLAFSVAVFNAGSAPANFGIENFTVMAGEKQLSVFSVDQLIGKAKNRARWKQFGVAMLGGLAAGAAASQRATYNSAFYTPTGTYYSSFSAPSAYGQVQSAAISAGTGYTIVAIQNQLDRTREALGDSVIQTSTLDPGESYAGKIVLQKTSTSKLPQRISITINWNGEQYPFTFQMAKPGTTPPVFTAIAREAPAPAPASFVQATYTPPVATSRPLRQLAAPTPAADLGALLQRTAEYMPRPSLLDDGTAVSDFSVSGTELVLTAMAPGRATSLTAYARSEASLAICSKRAFMPLLQQGATIRTVYLAPGKHRIGEVVVTPSDCGAH